MNDIFISYARSTEAEARRIGEALRALGYGVWRDDELPAHRDYSEVIEERLRAAKAVVVVWSAEAIRSQWVRAEAEVAREAGTLVQLTIDGAALPLPFNRIQCADLRGWAGDPSAPGWCKVTASVAELARGSSPPSPAPASHRDAPSAPTPERLTIAVAGLADPAGEAKGDDFADGLAAEIGAALARFPVLLVVEPGSGSPRYRLEGSVRRSGERARITLAVTEAATGQRVWVERFDESLADPFALQDDLAARVAARVETAVLFCETRRLAARPLDGLTAHELYLRSREAIRRSGLEQVAEIEALSERAIVLDPRHSQALAFLACGLGFRIAYAKPGGDLAGVRERYAEMAKRAMLAGADDPEVLTFIGEAYLLAGGDLVAARALVDRALAINPALALAWDISANLRMAAGEYEDALARYERCLRLDPQSPWRTYAWPSMAGCMTALGRFEEAIPLAKEGLQIAPDNPWGRATLLAALAHSGRLDEARTALAAFDPRQAAVLEGGHLGPKLAAMIGDALELVGAATGAVMEEAWRR